MFRQKLHLLALLSFLWLTLVTPAWAHISVNPRSADSGGRHQLFYVRAPADTESPVVELGFEVDEAWIRNGGEVNSFENLPNWKVSVERDAGGKVCKVVWTGGQALSGTFQMIHFSMNTPTEPGKYHFKSWQRLADGRVIRFDQTPAEGGPRPYPIVEIRAPRTEPQLAAVVGGTSTQYYALLIAFLALVVALTALRNSQTRR